MNAENEPQNHSTGPVDRFLEAVRSATIADCDAWATGADLDATVPHWRFHRSGADQIRDTYRSWFADPGDFEELERTPVADGEIVRYLLAWTENGVPHTAHHLHLLRVADDAIVSDVVMCGGRWPASLMAEMEAADAR
jgi:hypothetical protein